MEFKKGSAERLALKSRKNALSETSYMTYVSLGAGGDIEINSLGERKRN